MERCLQVSLSGAPAPASLVALAAVVAVVLTSRRARSLSLSGAAAALAVGAIAAVAGYEFATLLLIFFSSASALSRLGREAKAQLVGAIVEKGDERDAAQVLANGGVFAAAALASLLWPCAHTGALAAAGGAIAAACADTWSTEIGTLSLSPPRSIISGRVVPPGTSGGVTKLGYTATIAGAALMGLSARLLGWPSAVALAIVAGGVVGALTDSLVGALWQARRRCPTCNTLTERAVHRCGASTVAAGGFRWLDNDGVNALCTLAGAFGALAAWALLR